MADSKLTALTEISVPALEDLLYTVDDPSGTPASNKVTLTRALGLLNHVVQGRLTLATGYPVYDPQPATPSSTDTGTEVCTFSTAHGWTTGTMVTPSATGGNLTAGTTYYVNALSTTTCAFYTTLANAEADSSRVNLSASITAEIRPFGVQSTTVRFAPYNGNLISIYDGTRWKLYTFTELSLALGAVTSGLPYDIFVYDNSGTLTLEKVAWTNGTTRATALTTQNGVYVKSGDTTRRYLGTIYTVSTAATEDSEGGVVSQVGGKRFVWNLYNQLNRPVAVFDGTSTWTYATTTFRQANAASGNKVEFIVGTPVGSRATMSLIAMADIDAGEWCFNGLGVDSTTVADTLRPISYSAAGISVSSVSMSDCCLGVGYHYIAWLERSGSGTITFDGNSGETQGRQSGMTGTVTA